MTSPATFLTTMVGFGSAGRYIRFMRSDNGWWELRRPGLFNRAARHQYAVTVRATGSGIRAWVNLIANSPRPLAALPVLPDS